MKAAQRAYYEAHRQECIDRAKAYYAEHREERLVAIAEWIKRNPELRRRTKQKAYRKNPEYERERSLRYYEANKHRWRAYSATRRARQGSSTPEMRAFILELVQQPCAYCGAPEGIEIDHIVPLARGGAHEQNNLAPACGPCNRSKGAKLLSEWKVAA